MRRIFLILAVSFTIWGFTFAQSRIVELDKVKELRLLESTPDDAIKILAADSLTLSNSLPIQHFYRPNANVTIYYSSGDCEGSEDWNIAAGKVTKIIVHLKDLIDLKNVGIDYSKFRKEAIWGIKEGGYVYHDKISGIAIKVYDDWVDSIIFSPPAKNYSLLCNKKEVKKYYSGKRWNRNPEMKNAIIDLNPPANVTNLELSQTEILLGCDSITSSQNTSCPNSSKQISVFTTAVNPDGDVLTYNYFISSGKIIGQGAKVVWDLSGVKAGTYTITAVADDGCGPCGKYITKTVVVKECPDCPVK